MLKSYTLFDKPLEELPQGRLLITTLNEHSYNVARKDTDFNAALKGSQILLPDGISVVGATRFLTGKN
jgi:N-acetylglucosaminyldiphosphoundecaprenol N-acetyl-beta-D-mannosaminyltransferase